MIPDSLHSPLDQAYVITKLGGENRLAKAFAEYMATPDPRRIMVNYGFVLPGESAMR